MDKATFNILDTLSRELGSTISIHELTARIREYHGAAYYAGTYNKIIELQKQGFITLTKAGRSTIPALDFSSYPLQDHLAEIELRNKLEFLEKRKAFQLLLEDIEAYAYADPTIESISLINPDRNARLNRTELLILLHDASSDTLPNNRINIHNAMRSLQSNRNIRIDPLPLTPKEFRSLLIAEEINPVKEMLANKITFHNPSSFWFNITRIMRGPVRFKLETEETNLGEISGTDLNYNLSRFGYTELGINIREGRRICIETIITALMIGDEARRIDAIPIILAKNKANYELLLFLSQKYESSDRLLGLLKVLQRLKPNNDIEHAIKLLEAMETKEIKANAKSIEQKMRLYHAVG